MSWDTTEMDCTASLYDLTLPANEDQMKVCACVCRFMSSGSVSW